MIKSILTSIVALITGLTSHASTTSSDESASQASALEKEFSDILSDAVAKGAAVLEPNATLETSAETLQILLQLSRSKEKFDRPVLIFRNKKILVNDPKQLEKILSRPGQTMTSI